MKVLSLILTLMTAAPAFACGIAGPASAPLVIEEYADFHCPYCAKGANEMAQVLKDYPGQVKLVFRNMPLDFHGTGALNAAKAFAAACQQSATLADLLQNEFFSKQDKLIRDGDTFIFSTAGKIGLDVDRLKRDMESTAVKQSLANDQKLAADHGFKGTPSFMIGSEAVTGALPLAEFKKVIDKQLGH